jgi:hypothetical protein
MSKRLVYICDWLPPDFGAVGQYAMQEARDWVKRGFAVTLVGLTSEASSRGLAEPVGEGSVEIVRVDRRKYQKQRFEGAKQRRVVVRREERTPRRVGHRSPPGDSACDQVSREWRP